MSDNGDAGASGASSAATPAAAPSTPAPAVGDKRKAESDAQLSPPPMFKVPSHDPKAFLRPPILTVDTSLSFQDDEPVVPRTPANVRSMHRTELHAAVCSGNVSEATRLLEGGHPVDPQEEHGFTPLMNACALERQPEPRKKLVALLLAHNADTCRSDKEGYSCLHWASACGAKDCIAALLEEVGEEVRRAWATCATRSAYFACAAPPDTETLCIVPRLAPSRPLDDEVPGK